jgi:hypothetical protein
MKWNNFLSLVLVAIVVAVSFIFIKNNMSKQLDYYKKIQSANEQMINSVNN